MGDVRAVLQAVTDKPVMVLWFSDGAYVLMDSGSAITADAFEKAHFYAIIVPKNISILTAQGLDFCCILMYYVENMRRYHEKFRKFGAKI